ncbi:DUF1003 domain-containing protein [Massilia varians]|uniref:DUF1003 domain-containing protein n=1 Tax=Massilia varians TaxID=457921 RepID=UPI0024924065|nr:DUF1003 domain-containing protein [Massilia varians]
METPDRSREALPFAFQEHLGTVAEFYARHNQDLSPAQRAVERISFFLGSPAYVVGNLVFVVLWIAWNLAAPELGFDQWDEPPFFWLQGLIALNAFVISTTVLIRQNRMSTLASQHSPPRPADQPAGGRKEQQDYPHAVRTAARPAQCPRQARSRGRRTVQTDRYPSRPVHHRGLGGTAQLHPEIIDCAGS